MSALAGIFASRRRSSSPSDPYFSSVDLLLVADGNSSTSYKDYSANNRSVTPYNAVTLEALGGVNCFRFQGSSATVNNSVNGRILTSISALGTGDYTIELWGAYAVQNGGQRLFELGTSDASRSSILPYYDSANHGVVLINNTGFGDLATNYIDSTIRHHCIMRKSGVTYYFVDGSLIASTSTSFNITETQLMLGTAWDYRGGLNGYIESFRTTLLARYSETGFTPDSTFYKH